VDVGSGALFGGPIRREQMASPSVESETDEERPNLLSRKVRSTPTRAAHAGLKKRHRMPNTSAGGSNLGKPLIPTRREFRCGPRTRLLTGSQISMVLEFGRTFKMSHDRGWREPCCSEHGS
jgi:hypothetical protein